MTAIELLESALKNTRRRQMTRVQVLILIALAKSGKPLQIVELSELTNEIRQNIYRAVEIMDGDLVTVRRPKRVETFVHLRQDGVNVLIDILKMERKCDEKEDC